MGGKAIKLNVAKFTSGQGNNTGKKIFKILSCNILNPKDRRANGTF